MTLEDLKLRAWGVGGKVWTVLGSVAGFAVFLGQYLDLIPEQYRTSKLYYLAAGFVGFGLWFNQGFKKPDPAALSRAAPKAGGFVTLFASSFIVVFSVAIVLLVVGQYAAAGLAALLGGVVVFLITNRLARVSLLALALLLGAGTARADSSPGGPLSVYLGTFRGESITLQFGLGLSGSAYDFGTRQVTRDVQFTGLTELSVGDFPVALIGGAGFQTGENQGLALQIGPEYRPLNAAVLFTVVPIGSTNSYGIAAGYVVRF